MARYNVGQSIRYKPVGGPNSNTPESKGVVRDVIENSGEGEEETRYQIENQNTGKRSSIKESNILGTI
ncbi:hypothetical protein AJ79_00069 [Helicocarpus griseus UAMH5409]|uniref:Hypervirulence associated protein TUDOR domain-containing protein n=1 Tax=Helicocarpus griseus UAMH5409 TaxID=1447875 RepID=A0A2B7YCP1_9EURO|nr:hypothetical protein AJ79_00069 [Helicocarpus griseus UAMH5409]